MKKKISIKEISELSGVSVATVSRVINQNGRFSKETEERVRKVIEEYNYAPNLVARSLRTSKVPVVGIIVPDITNEFFAKVTLELQNNLMQLGYSAIICNTDEVPAVEQRHLAMLSSQQVSGLIYISGEAVEGQRILQIPTVYIDRKPPFLADGQNFVLIQSDNEHGGYLAACELLERGCRRCAIVTYRNAVSSHHDRYEGFLRALKESGIAPEEDLVVRCASVDIREGYRQVKALFEREGAVDGIFCTADVLAYGALGALDERGKKVPEDVRLIGFDNISLAEMSRPPLTSIKQSIEEFGILGANALVSMIDGAPLNKKRYLLPVEVIRRGTC